MQELIVGVDIGGTNTRLGLVDVTGRVWGDLAWIRTAADPREAVQDMVEAVVKLRGQAPSECKVIGLGMACPGPLDQEAGVVLDPPNLKRWAGFPLVQVMSDATGLTAVTLENDANAAALGEYWRGSGRGMRCMLLISLGTGVGGGIVLDGRLWSGPGGVGGELGHFSIDPDGPECECGNRGCLEAFASAGAIERRAQEAARREPSSALAVASREQRLTPRVVHDLAARGDAVARGVLEETARYVGIALAGLTNIFNPDGIVMSGGVSATFEIVEPVIRKEIEERSFEQAGRQVTILKSALGDLAGVIGGSAAFLHRERAIPRPWVIDRIVEPVFVRALHIGRTGTEAAVVKLTGDRYQVVSEVRKAPQASNKGDVVALALSCATDAQHQSGLRDDQIWGSGISTPGPVDAKKKWVGEVQEMGWRTVDLAEAFADLSGPLFVEKDADAAALAELRFGRGRGLDDFLVLYLGSGTGSGIVIGGSLYRGFNGTAGEIGRQTINYAARPFLSGCLEAYTGGTALLEQVKSSMEDMAPSLKQKALARQLGYGDICNAADKGDKRCKSLLADMGSRLGTAIADYLNLMNPKRVIVAGPLAVAWPHFEGKMWEEVHLRSYPEAREHVYIEPTDFGESGDTVAAAAAFAAQWRPGKAEG